MYLVGVISDNKEIANVFKKEFDKSRAEIINLDLKNIENFKNVKFNLVLISNLEKNKKNSTFKKIVSNSNIAVVNTDNKKNLEILENLKGTVITYGFNQKATITASSVEDSNISICVQRVIENVNGEKIEPIEYVENMEDIKNIEISDVIGVKTIENLLTKKKN